MYSLTTEPTPDFQKVQSALQVSVCKGLQLPDN